jgi:hypothetical protein
MLSNCLNNMFLSYAERRKEKVKNESEAGAASTPSAADAQHHDDGAGSGADGDNAPGTGKADAIRDVHPPAQKYRLTDQMKSIVWQLVMLSNECCRLENEKK